MRLSDEQLAQYFGDGFLIVEDAKASLSRLYATAQP